MEKDLENEIEGDAAGPAEQTGWQAWLRELKGEKEIDVQSYSPLTLAYIGDGIYNLIIKVLVVSGGNRPVRKLHEETSSIVKASAQSEMMRALQPLLTEEEHTIYRRGRNTKMVSPAKNQSLTDYRRATGFEALIGWLFLKNEEKRLLELIRIGLEHLNEGKEV